MQRMFIWVQISRRTQSNCTRARNYVYSVSLNSWMMGQMELLIGACATIGRGRGGHRWADRIMANEGTDVNARRSKEKKWDRKHPHIKSTPVFQILPTHWISASTGNDKTPRYCIGLTEKKLEHLQFFTASWLNGAVACTSLSQLQNSWHSSKTAAKPTDKSFNM